MSSSEGTAYKNAIGGGLALKGGLSLKSHKPDAARKKSKKKKKKEKKKKREREESKRADGAAGHKREREVVESDDDEEKEREMYEAADTRTPAQRAFDDIKKKRLKKDVEKWTAKTHREKINEFNLYLNSLSEHHDVPKVANAGLG